MNSMGTTQDRILETLKENSKGLTAMEIAIEMKYPYNKIPTMLTRMKNFSMVDFIFKDNEKIWKVNNKGENNG